MALDFAGAISQIELLLIKVRFPYPGIDVPHHK